MTKTHLFWRPSIATHAHASICTACDQSHAGSLGAPSRLPRGSRHRNSALAPARCPAKEVG